MDNPITISFDPLGASLVSVPLEWRKFADLSLYFTLLDRNANPINLAGVDMWFIIKRYFEDADNLYLLQKRTSDNNIVIIDAESGLFKINLGKTDIPVLPVWDSKFAYILTMQMNSKIYNLLTGTIKIINNPSVTYG